MMSSEKVFQDNIHNPAHYTIYPVQPIEITRYLGFCLGNVTKYVLRAPFKGGVEDCEKALEYLRLETITPQPALSYFAYMELSNAQEKLNKFFRSSDGDILWQDLADCLADFLEDLSTYLLQLEARADQWCAGYAREEMFSRIQQLKRILELRDTTGQIYEGMTGLPMKVTSMNKPV